VWRVRLADGEEVDLPATNLKARPCGFGEAWLRVANNGASLEIAQTKLQVLIATLTYRVLRAPENYNEALKSEGLCQVSVPKAAIPRLCGQWVRKAMIDFNAIVGMLPAGPAAELQEIDISTVQIQAGDVAQGLDEGEWKDALILERDPIQDTALRWLENNKKEKISRHCIRPYKHLALDGQLVIFGDRRAQRACSLHAMGSAETAVPSYYSASHLLPEDDDEVMGLSHFQLDRGGKLPRIETVKQRITRVSAVTQAIIERVGSLALVAGTRRQRKQAIALLDLVAGAAKNGKISSIPSVLAPECTSVRVPRVAVQASLEVLREMATESQILPFWIEAEDDDGDDIELFEPGMAVKGVYEGEWHDAIIKATKLSEEKVLVRWAADQSESVLPIRKVKRVLTQAGKTARLRKYWLRWPWTLVVLGAPWERKVVALRIMVRSEEMCPGLWSFEVQETIEELLAGMACEDGDADATEEVDPVGVEVKAVSGEAAEPYFDQLLEKPGRIAMQRAMKAAHCFMQLLSDSWLFIVGNKEERVCGLTYLRWILQQQQWVKDQGQICTLMAKRAGEDYENADLVSKAGVTEVFTAEEWSEFLESRGARGDVTTLPATSRQCWWLNPTPLKSVESTTNTIIFLDQGPGGPTDWVPTAAAHIHICGRDAAGRAKAADRLKELLRKVDPECGPEDQESLAKITKKAHKRQWDGGRVFGAPQDDHAAKKQKEEAIKPVPPVSTAPAALAVSVPTKPMDVLRSLDKWPVSIDDWKMLQTTIWAGHSPLPEGWIRVWSRSKDTEYYFRLKDGRTSFNLQDLTAA